LEFSLLLLGFLVQWLLALSKPHCILSWVEKPAFFVVGHIRSQLLSSNDTSSILVIIIVILHHAFSYSWLSLVSQRQLFEWAELALKLLMGRIRVITHVKEVIQMHIYFLKVDFSSCPWIATNQRLACLLRLFSQSSGLSRIFSQSYVGNPAMIILIAFQAVIRSKIL
jgi:hypothetical protein